MSMSMVVSYKKQVILGILLLIILLTIIEVFANIWLYNFYRCDFEDNELFKKVDPEIKRKICLDNIGLGLNIQELSNIHETRPGYKVFDTNLVKINSERFRAAEFQKDKPENTFRIFNIGGSTTFGAGVLDNQTYPYYLQELYDDASLPFKIEVINTGWADMNSIKEVQLIKERLIGFDPDLFIVYDGWNDMALQTTGYSSPTLWKERWIEICDLGEQYGYDTIITLQPMVNTGEKKLTAQEQINFIKIEEEKLFENYPEYVKKLNELRDHCTLTADLRGLFDNYEEPIYYDEGHTGPKGNQIIAEKFYQLSFPIVKEGSKKIALDNDRIPPLKLETDEPQDSTRYLEIKGDSIGTSFIAYQVIVTGQISLGPIANPEDVLSSDGTTIDGGIMPAGIDDFFYTGDIVSITSDKPILSFVDGVEIPTVDNDGIPPLNLETDEPQVSSDMDYFLEESFSVLRDIFSYYKTPKVLPLIF